MDDRAVSPVVGKTLEVAVLVVFVGVISAALFGSVVPAYRTAAGDEVADRVLVSVTGQVETAADVPPTVDSRRTELSLPRTIRGAAYVVRTTQVNGTPALVLDHPHPRIGGRFPLALSDRVAVVEGTAQSTEPSVVVVTVREGGRLEVLLR